MAPCPAPGESRPGESQGWCTAQASGLPSLASTFALSSIAFQRHRRGDFSTQRPAPRAQGPGLCVEIYDDYAHHPTEIEACIKAMGSSRPQSDPAVDEAMDWPEPSTARGSWGEMGGTWDRKAHDGPLVSVWGDYLAGPVAAAAGCRLATHGSGMSRASALSDHYTGGGWEGRPRVQALHRDFQEPPVQGEGKEGGGPAEQTWAVIQPHTFSRVQASGRVRLARPGGSDRWLPMLTGLRSGLGHCWRSRFGRCRRPCCCGGGC